MHTAWISPFHLKIWLSEVKRRRMHWLKIKIRARIFLMDILTSRIGKRNQNTSIWYVLWGYSSKFQLWLRSQKRLRKFPIISESKQKKSQYRKFGMTGLKSNLRATEKYAYCLGYLHFTSRYGFPKLNATYHFYLKSG